MEMQNLLEKNRVMHHLLQKAAGDALEFDEVARQLKELIGASVYMIDKHGDVLGYSDEEDMALFSLEELSARKIEDGEMGWLFGFTQTEVNQLKNGHIVTLVPMVNVNERLGTVLYARRDRGFDQEDLMLLEYGAVVASIQLMRIGIGKPFCKSNLFHQLKDHFIQFLFSMIITESIDIHRNLPNRAITLST